MYTRLLVPLDGTPEAEAAPATCQDSCRGAWIPDHRDPGRGKNPFGKEVAGFTAETTLNRREFGLNWNAALESGGLLVGETSTS
jgi:hypothetical protein